MVNPKSRLGYMYGLGVKKDPYERPLPTGEEKFQSIVASEGAYYAYGRLPERESPGKGKRKAGDALNLDLRQSLGTPKYVPLPDIGSAEIRNPGFSS
jgi:hypothetical protein